ncbi:MAG: serine hydrolase [Kofleriaceae bacterium]
MTRVALALALSFTVACRGATPSTPRTPAPETAARISRIENSLGPGRQVVGEEVRFSLTDRMRELKIPAVSVAVFENHQIVWAKAYGLADVDGTLIATSDTLFQAASISKPLNALAVMLAVADGTLRPLDTPINDQLATWELPDSEHTTSTPVTLRHLLSHTAGTTVHGFPGYASNAPLPTTVQILDGAPPANSPPVRVDIPPGTFRYSGGGTTIAQLALVDRSKKPYPAILEERVLAPLGMTDSTFEQPLPASRAAVAANAYSPDGTPVKGRFHVYPELGAAGLWTTPSDLARFFAELSLARAGRSKVIPQKVAIEMTTPVGDGPTGLGPFLQTRNGAKFFGHGGGNAGFRCSAIASLDDGYGVVIMTSSDNGGQILGEIENAVFAEYRWPGMRTPLVRFAMSDEKRARFVGVYPGRRFIPNVVDDRAGKLMLGPPVGKRIELVPIADDAVVGLDGEVIRATSNGALEITDAAGSPIQKLARIGSAEIHPLIELAAGRFDGAVAVWKMSAAKDTARARDEEAQANQYGYHLLGESPADAVLVLRLIAAVFPESSNAHDSLGEAYMRTGDTANAIAEYEKAIATLDADPRIPAPAKATARANAEKHLASLRAN